MKAHFEQVQTLPENSFRIFLHEVSEFDAPWHYHPEYELTLILSSQGIRYVGNSMEGFGPGDLVLLGPNLPHCWKNQGEQQESARAVVIQFPEQFLGTGWLGNPEFTHIRRLLQYARQGIRFDDPVKAPAQQLMLNMLDEPPFRRLRSLLDLLDLLAAPYNGQLLCEEGVSYPLDLEDNRRINIIHNYVREHYREKITLSAVAALASMKEESFSRFFSRIMHKPFFTFLNEYRITMACKLLIETDMQVARAGFACGYESLPFFYRQFSRYRGISPQAYRKRFRSTAGPGSG